MKLLEGINILFQGIAFKPNGSGLIFGFFFISAWFFIPMAIAHFLGKQMSEIYSWVNTEKKEGLEVFK